MRLRMKNLLCVVLAVLAACGDDDSGGGGAAADAAPGSQLEPAEACRQYLDCVLITAPSSYAALLDLYGQDSECWKSTAETMKCGQACLVAYEQIKSQCATADCIDSYEPNNDVHQAHVLPIQVDAAICPADDMDVWLVQAAGGTPIRISVKASPITEVVTLQLRNHAGIVVSTNHDTIYVSSLPDGIYSLEVTGSGPLDYTLDASF
jgi:hypothetical protein